MNKSLKRYIALIILGVILIIFNLVMYINSYSFYQDEYGTDISFNSDYLVALIISVIFLIYNVFGFLNKNNLKEYFIILGVISSLFVCLYSNGCLLKALNKSESYIDYQNYLYIGVLSLGFFLYFLLYYFENKRSKV